MKNVESVRKIATVSVVVFFSILFLVPGSLVGGGSVSFIATTCFTIAAAYAFIVRTAPIDVAICRSLRTDTNPAIVECATVAGLFALFYAFIFTQVQIPILSPLPEVDRMIPVVNFGPLYRVMNELIFLTIPMAVFIVHRRGKSRLSGILLLIAAFVFLLSLGFRSRLIDFIAILILSVVVIRVVKEGTLKIFSARVLMFGAIGASIALSLITYLTAARHGFDNPIDALHEVIDRVFLLNYRVNIGRIDDYVAAEGYAFGQTYLLDPLSVVIPSLKSHQVYITEYFNWTNSNLFIMTPTAYGEGFYNFGYFAVLFVPPIILFYRFISEWFIYEAVRISNAGLISFGLIVNCIYYVPRVLVTGGVSNAYTVKFASLVVAFIVARLSIMTIERIFRYQTRNGSAIREGGFGQPLPKSRY